MTTILIDGYQSGSGRGVGNYVDNILKRIDNMSAAPNITVIARCKNKKDLEGLQHIKVIFMPSVPLVFWENILLPIVCWFLRPKVLHSPCNSGPLLPVFAKRILTLHDVIFMHGSNKVQQATNLYQRFGRMYLNFNVKILSQFYDTIVTVSDFSRKEIVSALSVDPTIVKRIYEGAGTSFEFSDNGYLNRKNILHFGSDDPRKNTNASIVAFKESGLSVYGFRLIIVGSCNEIKIRSATKSLLDETIEFKGFLDTNELSELTSTSFCLLYCSHYEGFGMPIVEFQKIGVPVITANSTSCAEICGDGGLLIDPNKIEHISDALKSLHCDTTAWLLCQNLGFSNCERFSWDKCALELHSIYEGQGLTLAKGKSN